MISRVLFESERFQRRELVDSREDCLLLKRLNRYISGVMGLGIYRR